jgi:GNAT superfamily N-acetyltransferase
MHGGHLPEVHRIERASYQRPWSLAGLRHEIEDNPVAVCRALLEDTLALGRSHGCRRVTLEVRARNRAVRALYRSLGFRQAGRRPGHYEPDKEDAIMMELSLDP